MGHVGMKMKSTLRVAPPLVRAITVLSAPLSTFNSSIFLTTRLKLISNDSGDTDDPEIKIIS
jgi:hypothetical protein